MAWTEERVELLKKLWADGLSARQIADQLGGVTRNAVIGKVHRLGLSGRATAATTSARAKTVRKPAKKRAASPQKAVDEGGAGAAPQQPQKTNTAAHDAASRRRPEPEVVDSKLLNPVDELDIPLDERVAIEDLREGQCKWPIGDPTSEDFHFCGRNQHGEGVYCEFHAAKAYQPARRSQRKKEQRQLISYK